MRPRGATVARLTPDQKVACSNHVGVMVVFLKGGFLFIGKRKLQTYFFSRHTLEIHKHSLCINSIFSYIQHGPKVFLHFKRR